MASVFSDIIVPHGSEMQMPRPVRKLPTSNMLESNARLQGSCINHQATVQKSSDGGSRTIEQQSFLSTERTTKRQKAWESEACPQEQPFVPGKITKLLRRRPSDRLRGDLGACLSHRSYLPLWFL
ncbi:unnamed protein product [Arctia plantaginis]|uniref:Uncharacterized protein n=1 Tax=Arctia plantaginis TaxID=874455 RepID=A0A8S0ZF16_ARCPL|nr:unnamed protein product [Arctia plantaginis]